MRPTFSWYIGAMTVVSIRELSHETSHALRLVKAGETVEITERGKVIGRIVPAGPEDDVRARLIEEGQLIPATENPESLLATVRRRLATEPVDHENTLTEGLQTMREDERY